MYSNPANDVEKQAIFSAIEGYGREQFKEPKQIQAEAAELLALSQTARSKLADQDLSTTFIERINSGLVIGTSCEVIPSISEVPAIAKQFLGQHSLPFSVQVQQTQTLQELNWDDIETNSGVEQDHSVGICLADFGIAETGSFVIHSSPAMPVLLNFLPLYLLVVLPKSRLLAYLDDYGKIANSMAEQNQTPRNMCLITGASGTTDIEGVLVQGAHGPEFVHVVIVTDK